MWTPDADPTPGLTVYQLAPGDVIPVNALNEALRVRPADMAIVVDGMQAGLASELIADSPLHGRLLSLVTKALDATDHGRRLMRSADDHSVGETLNDPGYRRLRRRRDEADQSGQVVVGNQLSRYMALIGLQRVITNWTEYVEAT